MLIAFSLSWYIVWLSCWLFWVLMAVMEGVEIGKMYCYQQMGLSQLG